MKCPNCGNEFESNFCSQCGYSVNPAAPQPTPPGYPPQQPYSAPPVKKKNKGCLIGACIAGVVVVLLIIAMVALAAKLGKEYVDNSNLLDDVTQSQSAEEITPDQYQLLYNKDGVKITLKYLDMKGSYMGPEVKLLLENSSSVAKTIQVQELSVNGYMLDGILSCNVAPGKKANDDIKIMSTQLKENNIDDITKLEVSFRIFDSDNFSNLVETDTYKIDF